MRRGQESGALMTGLVPLREETPESLLSRADMGGHREKAAVCRPEKVLSPEPNHASSP